MFGLFLLLWIFCTTMFVIGMINPQKALIPYAKRGRKQVFIFWFVAGFICFILAGTSATDSKNSIDEDELSKSLNNYETTAETIVRSIETIEPTNEPTPSEIPTELVLTATPTILNTPSEKIVYITDTGSKYHAYGCRFLKDSCIEITLKEAQAKGYTPCGVCNP